MGLLKFFSSLRLTVACLILWVILIFVATLAQVQLGIFFAKKIFFESWIVFWPVTSMIKLPVFPGGFLIGSVVLINLIAAHFTRFKWTWQKSGIWLVHTGLILLLIGGGLTSLLGVEMQLSLSEGQQKNYAQRLDAWELAVISSVDSGQDEVVAIPQTWLEKPGIIAHPKLPFQLKILAYFPNTSLRMGAGAATQGIGRQVQAVSAPLNTQEVGFNTPSTYVEVFEGGKSHGVWLLSSGLGAAQEIFVGGKGYRLSLRNRRHYFSFNVKLLDFKHDVYLGTQIPKNFSSSVEVMDKIGRETHLISMNQPLRYEGFTFYQASFADNDKTSIFQVVRNEAWWLPYVSCTLIFLGLFFHMGLMMWRGLKRG